MMLEKEKDSLKNVDDKKKEFKSNKYQTTFVDILQWEEVILSKQLDPYSSDRSIRTTVDIIPWVIYLDNKIERREVFY